MKRAVPYVVLAVLIVTGVVMAAKPLMQRASELRSDLTKVGGDTGDVMSGAAYQRFRARREAVAAMQSDLRALARAESAFIADSGWPTPYLPPSYGFKTESGNMGPYIRVERYGWSALMTNARTSMRCTLVAPLDTVTGRYTPGEPDCRSEAGEAWDAVLAAESANRPPEPSAPAPVPAPVPPAPPAPRRTRDWGPVNNTPPPMPFIMKNTVPSEYSSYGTWVACSTVTASRDKQRSGPPVFALRRGERFAAFSGDVHIERPGIVVFRHTTTNSQSAGPQVDSILFTPRDTLFLLNDIGEGYVLWWFRNQVDTGYQFWRDNGSDDFVPLPSDTVAMVRKATVTWWVRVRNEAGQEGWIEHNYYTMATGGYMDEAERCISSGR
jgi:hypothetical protein